MQKLEEPKQVRKERSSPLLPVTAIVAARNEATEHSDVDLFVDYDSECFTFVELIRLRKRLSEILGRPADLTTREGLHPLLRPTIEAEAIKVL